MYYGTKLCNLLDTQVTVIVGVIDYCIVIVLYIKIYLKDNSLNI